MNGVNNRMNKKNKKKIVKNENEIKNRINGILINNEKKQQN